MRVERVHPCAHGLYHGPLRAMMTLCLPVEMIELRLVVVAPLLLELLQDSPAVQPWLVRHEPEDVLPDCQRAPGHRPRHRATAGDAEEPRGVGVLDDEGDGLPGGVEQEVVDLWILLHERNLSLERRRVTRALQGPFVSGAEGAHVLNGFAHAGEGLFVREIQIYPRASRGFDAAGMFMLGPILLLTLSGAVTHAHLELRLARTADGEFTAGALIFWLFLAVLALHIVCGHDELHRMRHE